MSAQPPTGRRWLTEQEQDVYRLRDFDELPLLIQKLAWVQPKLAYNYERVRVWLKSRGKIWWTPV
jgi:hypothetical protein